MGSPKWHLVSGGLVYEIFTYFDSSYWCCCFEKVFCRCAVLFTDTPTYHLLLSCSFLNPFHDYSACLTCLTCVICRMSYAGNGCICFECGHVGLPRNNDEACAAKGDASSPSPDFGFVCKKCLTSNSVNLVLGMQRDGSVLPSL